MPQNIITPMTDVQCLYNARIKYYPDCSKVTCFSRPIFNPDKVERVKDDDAPKESIYTYNLTTGKRELRVIDGLTALNPFTGKVTRLKEWEEKPPRDDSVKRAKDKAFDIAAANEFRYFITLTLNRDMVGDRTSTTDIYPKLKNWLSNMVQRYGMKYIIFPEYHKRLEFNGKQAIHFHGLIDAEGLKLQDSGRRTKQGKTIYNLDNWSLGYITAIEYDGGEGMKKYITKYCTKGNYKIFGKFYLSGGKGLQREVPTEYMNLDYSLLDVQEYQVPNAGLSVKYYNMNF